MKWDAQQVYMEVIGQVSTNVLSQSGYFQADKDLALELPYSAKCVWTD